jgi:hypothetical protein
MLANCQPVKSVFIANVFPSVICLRLFLTQWKGLDSVWVPYKLKNGLSVIMQIGFPFLWMLVFFGYSAERIASFLREMGNGRNLYIILGIYKIPPEEGDRD